MKQLNLIAASIILIMACNNKEQNNNTKAPNEAKKSTITIKGSDTVLPLSQKEAEAYMKEHPETSITIVGGGSGVGISSLLEQTTDVAMSSRPVKMDEKLKFKSKNINLVEVIIANDALAVVVNPNNPVDKLTHEQIADIFTGKITNWKEVGGKDTKIICYSRETSSGTYEFFKEHVMDKKNYASTVLNMPATGAIIQSISQTEGAIGYVGLAYVTKDVKYVAVSYDQGKNYVAPLIVNAENGSYPISRPLYYYFSEDKKETVSGFVDYIKSAKGQQLILDVGYVPLKK